MKEKPIREIKRRFMDLQTEASQILGGLKIHIDLFKELINAMGLENAKRDDFLKEKIQKYIESDILQGSAVFLDNLMKYTEEEAKQRIYYVKKELTDLIEINQKIGS